MKKLVFIAATIAALLAALIAVGSCAVAPEEAERWTFSVVDAQIYDVEVTN